MPYPLDATDLRIVRLLQDDGRMSNVEIARNLGMPEATVRKRVERLLATKAIRVAALPDLAAVDCPIVTLVSLQVAPAHVQAVSRALAALPEVRWAALTMGEHNLVLEATFAAEDQLVEFLTSQLAGIPGIAAVATTRVLRPLKTLAEWRLPSAPNPLILIVDDDPDFREQTCTVLEAEGYRVLGARNGTEALACMRRQHPSLVILDVMMEGLLDGLDASRAMRLDQNLQRIPIIMVTSIAQSEYAGMFPTDEQIPVDAFLTKPVSPARLLAEVRRLLAAS